uniref:Uncharacterized protein n=1 Tax=Siphoviridae sp. ctLqe90 TaxID=2825456 RepID=A0A8S5Q3M8_9CAUD|nr:MAG TPA: hypothetical protein [Siphoviridae sp. ctLqe90]
MLIATAKANTQTKITPIITIFLLLYLIKKIYQ